MTGAILGGALIGVAAVWLMTSLGRVAGISGIAATALKRPWPAWAVLFVIGLMVGGAGTTLLLDGAIDGRNAAPAAISPWLVLGGVLVGFGTRLGSGCTSGHGVCGIARLSKRSIVATVVFLAVAMLTATGVHGS